MTIWEFLLPIVGADIRFPVTVVFLLVTFAWSLVLSRSVVMAAIIVLIDAFFMRWFPGMVMGGTMSGLGLVTVGLAMIDSRMGQWAPKLSDEPEYLSDGALIGYKWLTQRTVLSEERIDAYWMSPVAGTRWSGGELTADRDPQRFNTDGIYVYYSENTARNTIYNEPGNQLVRLACDGKVVYHEIGARVKHVRIMKVLETGG